MYGPEGDPGPGRRHEFISSGKSIYQIWDQSQKKKLSAAEEKAFAARNYRAIFNQSDRRAAEASAAVTKAPDPAPAEARTDRYDFTAEIAQVEAQREEIARSCAQVSQWREETARAEAPVEKTAGAPAEETPAEARRRRSEARRAMWAGATTGRPSRGR